MPPTHATGAAASFFCAPCSFDDLVVTIDGLLEEGEEATVAPPPPLVTGGPCKGAAELAAAAAALGSAPAVATPN